jgi:hypothetical protein
MKTREAALLTATVIVVLIVIVWYSQRNRAAPSAKFQSGPYNIGVYDSPYENYPYYEGRAETSGWDGDERCVAYCEQSPCTIWCR